MKKPENKFSKKESNSLYQITIKERAIKQMAKLPKKIAEKIDELIQLLAQEPRPKGCKKLQGYDSVYRIRYSDYRVVYSVEDKHLVIEIIQIGNRKEIYKKL